MNRLHLVVAVAILGPLFWLFGPVLFSGRSFVFRDAAHYYYPLYEWVCQEWSHGRVPLWNLHENCGTPVLADTTSSIFYPGKVLFALPGLAYATRYTWYITAHLLLAAVASYGLARQWGSSTLAAGVCAVSYAFGGSVLFQYCNVIFLVGAAWLPLALLSAEQTLDRRSVLWTLAFGATLAMMTLGGDPQAAYHAALLALLLAFLLWRSRRAGSESSSRDEASHRSGLGWWQRFTEHHVVLLAFAAGSGAMLAAIQILPAIEWTRRSDRAAFVVPRSIYEIPEFLLRPASTSASQEWPTVREGFFGQPRAGTHHDHVYQFSVGPWRLAEFVWPNFSGRMFPTHHRWTHILPAEGRIWTPSLYIGLFPLLLALSSWRLRGGSVRNRWLSWMGLWAVLGSLGWYAFGWLLHELRCLLLHADPQDVLLGCPVGGLYWLMVAFLPGYVYFRYPAKLMVVAGLALSLLAARGWDRLFAAASSKLPVPLAGLATVSFAGAGILYTVRDSWWRDWLQAVPADDTFGPLDVSGAAGDVVRSFLHAGFLSVMLTCLWLWHRRTVRSGSTLVPVLSLLLCALDLSLAHQGMVPSAPRHLWYEPSPISQAIRADQAPEVDLRSYRIYRASPDRWAPAQWRETRSAQRQRAGLRWDRATLYPKYHLPIGMSLAESQGTMVSQDFLTFMQVAKQAGPRRPDGVHEPPLEILKLLSVRNFLLPAGFAYEQSECLEVPLSPTEKRIDDVALWRIANPLPRAWIVHQIEQLPPLRTRDPAEIQQRTKLVLFPENVPRAFQDSAIVESDQRLPESVPPGAGTNAGELCRLMVTEPQRIEIDVQLLSNGLVVLSDLFYPGWTAEVVDQDSGQRRHCPVLRVNRIMRGVHLPAGKYRIIYRYQPASFRWGAAISGLSWVLLATTGLVRYWRRVRRTAVV